MDYLDGLKVPTRILISGRPEGENHRRNDNRSKGQRKRVRWEEREKAYGIADAIELGAE